MDRNRLWVIGATLLIGVAVIVGWLLGVSPQLDLARAAKTERLAVEAQNIAYEQQLDELKADFADIDVLRDELDELRVAVPAGAQVPDLLADLAALATASGVVISDFSVSDAAPYEPVTAAVPEIAASDTTDAAATDATDAEATVPAAPAPAAVPVAAEPASNELVTSANFVSVPVSLTLVGGYDGVLDFLHGLQTGDRLVSVGTVNTVTSAEADAPATVTGTITGLIYVLLG